MRKGWGKGGGEDHWEDHWEWGRWGGEEYGTCLGSTRAKLVQDRPIHRQCKSFRQKKYHISLQGVSLLACEWCDITLIVSFAA